VQFFSQDLLGGFFHLLHTEMRDQRDRKLTGHTYEGTPWMHALYQTDMELMA
jgi:hypothetical protein